MTVRIIMAAAICLISTSAAAQSVPPAAPCLPGRAQLEPGRAKNMADSTPRGRPSDAEIRNRMPPPGPPTPDKRDIVAPRTLLPCPQG
jgi:hypothetical protein